MSKTPRFTECILFEDENFIFINKPSGISSLEDRNNKETNILQMAKRYCVDAQLCHRLDKETSGVMLIAKHNEAFKAMADKFENRNVHKVYHAICAGQLHVNNKAIVLPLSITAKGLAKVDIKNGKKATTLVSTIENFSSFTLLSCIPETGRLHQIRIHLASQNFPIVSDITYGGQYPYLSKLKRDFKTAKWENEQPMMQRVALHAHSLSFDAFEKKYSITAPYPKDFDVFLKLLAKYDKETAIYSPTI